MSLSHIYPKCIIEYVNKCKINNSSFLQKNSRRMNEVKKNWGEKNHHKANTTVIMVAAESPPGCYYQWVKVAEEIGY